ncbi:hypothetical protein JX265_010835 [Neoarthrinium moseri]|uniref:Lytic polysaccharide monooxygenase n=1 Tax=Neoarthrinium moseri TaxID=1658444 RepID=A0A9Q0ALB2_9PEZI|nr:uncharacterized protein JN550_010599 [Neoarthrinium moseri]KAI1841855.1 hypothetical protein JX266_011933 [Neoarthrinium moseri]KAI1858167.1 hypothetical protein JX265_010835 [Neoarthrinium moseri]KAI1861968.1 hypothetical protein JN550_010599 [Neoarthrinium moseri]
MRSTGTLTAYAGLLALAAQAHIILETPTPFKFAEYGPSNPLSPDGRDWPCKIPPGTTKLEIDGSPTPMVIGEPQTLSFTGHAVHGGGSCQISLTPGFEPNKKSKFAVIHTIEGGCPAINRKGNLDDGENPNIYNYTIPDGITPGDYTLAWTWLNRIGGQPEMYMNCAPVSVSSSSKARQRREKQVEKRKQFPGVFMANIGEASGGCLTTEALKAQQAIAFPHPGDSVDHPEGTDNLIRQPCDGNPDNNGVPADEPAIASSSSSSTATGTKTETQPSTLSSTKEQVSTLSTTKAQLSTLVTSLASEATAPVPHTSPAPPVASAVPTGLCTNGEFLCLVTQFSICTGGKWKAPQPLAADTHCTGGSGVGLNVVNSA